MELTQEQLIIEVLGIFTIDYFVKKTYYLKDLNNLKNNNYQKEDNVNAVRYKFVNHPNKYDK